MVPLHGNMLAYIYAHLWNLLVTDCTWNVLLKPCDSWQDDPTADPELMAELEAVMGDGNDKANEKARIQSMCFAR